MPIMTKTEFQKMRSSEMYYFSDPEIYSSLCHAKMVCAKLQTMTISDADYRSVIEDLIPGIPESSSVCPPFHCDHGNGIVMGVNTFLNYNCVILDGAYVRFGDNVAYPISIGDDTWLGGGVIVCPGVTIGKRCIVAAGSVVIHDVPDDCMVAGNPAEVKKHFQNE
jgi:maltose O-acetyltransferase